MVHSTSTMVPNLQSDGQLRLSYPGGFDLVASVAHPAGVVRERLALLSLQARLHLTPPLPNYYGCYRHRKHRRDTVTWVSLTQQEV